MDEAAGTTTAKSFVTALESLGGLHLEAGIAHREELEVL
ncbi:hypothetical protein L249_0024 [Ophiocordyceps polyrhachis-furcata BCC 54312]|uniref:Uncharacterized protein n=1 Tax=Ophiocordyceps polyrhachis-furcata BCC 54312 TaxID=1330021 RepID=A0A367LCT0_9HYPO|nr:hypothetical protein L249_0024 [Ophiocordyceps polyrhachis-furcata BCC 54312]